jgi:hypothetical protein
MGWDTIDTAPIDGSDILLGVFDDDGVWVIELVVARENEFEGDGWGMTRNICPYTHWHPIAEPPFPMSFQ